MGYRWRQDPPWSGGKLRYSDGVMDQTKFKQLIWNYYRKSGRDLAWRRTSDPYAIVVSEVMLQQTQVARVTKQFPIFMDWFPNWKELASAPVAEVVATWQGMGYNRRALYLKRIAETVINQHGGVLPVDEPQLRQLPGIGVNTAGSILAFAFNRPVVFIETNIRRVYLHHFFADAADVSDAQLRPIIVATLDRADPRLWYYALMDYGAHLAATVENPNRRSRHYTKQSQFEGSVRQIRGRVLKELVGDGQVSGSRLARSVGCSKARLEAVLGQLEAEGFIEQAIKGYRLKQ